MSPKKIRAKNAFTDRGRVLALTLLVALVALPASAAVFTVTLTNGAEIDTRYRPIESSSDATKIQFLTEHGNWITLPKALVSSIESDFEARGYGTVLDTDTVVLGYSINDLPAEGAEGVSAGDALLDFLRGPQQDPFTVNQFAEPTEAGGTPSGGVPVGFTRSTTPPLGGRGSGEPPIAGDNQ